MSAGDGYSHSLMQIGPCLSSEYRCSNGYCISRSQRCDGYNDCWDNSDEHSCTNSGSDDGIIPLSPTIP